MTATAPEPVPRDAYEAAALLRAQGHHVDIVADGQRYCPAGICPKEHP
ncbi:hypothetical protein ACWCV2_22810 [Streptomyces pseudogriseolus]